MGPAGRGATTLRDHLVLSQHRHVQYTDIMQLLQRVAHRRKIGDLGTAGVAAMQASIRMQYRRRRRIGFCGNICMRWGSGYSS